MIHVRLPRLVQLCSGVAVGGGITALLGWSLQIEFFNGLAPHSVSMNPVAAIGFVLAGIALWNLREEVNSPRRRYVVLTSGSLVILLGALQLTPHLVGAVFSPEEVLYSGASNGNTMAPVTSLALLLIGGAFVTFERRLAPQVWAAEWLALATLVVSLVSLVGYGYNVQSLHQLSFFNPMTLSTAIVPPCLALGTLLAQPHRGIMGVIFNDALGGLLARQLLPAAIVIPCLIGWLRLLGQQWGLYSAEFGATLLVSVTIVLFAGIIVWAAMVLNRVDQERQQASEALRQRSEQIYDLYSRAPCGYHSLDADGLILAINDTELEWLGYARDEIVGQVNIVDLLTAESRATFYDSFERFKQQGSVADLEFTMVRKDGAELSVVVNATAIYDAEGRYLASRSTVFNATERKRAERSARELNQQLEKRVKERTAELARSNADLVQINQENEMFVYGVSHDLRSPLVNLEGFSNELALVCDELRELIREGDLPQKFRERSLALVDEDMQQSIRFIQTAVARLSNIIDALLRLSRAGRIEYQWQKVEVDQIVVRVIESMSVSIYDRGAKINVGEMPPVYGDPTAIEQVFANLLGNAVNYLDPDRPGTIELGTLNVENTDETEAEETWQGRTFYVKDNGLGIPDAYHAKVFQALKRLHPHAAKGEGMGLAMVRRIVKRHGGEIWFTSEEGVGTTFYFTLPLYVPSDGQEPQETDQAERSANDYPRAVGYSVGGRR